MQKKPRKVVRFFVQIPVEIRSAQGISKGLARDISEDGIRIRSDGHVPSNDRVGITLRIPGFANMDLNFAADVRWVRNALGGTGRLVGLQFVHSPESFKKLQLLLWELQAGNLTEIERRFRTTRMDRKDVK